MPLPTRSAQRLLLFLAALVAALFVLSWLVATRGRFVPAISDLYVVCQYARAMAEGHAFHYNAGEAASTGATSLLHTMLLAAAWALGARGEALVAVAVGLGAALYFASVFVAYRLAARLSGPREAALAGVLVALGGPVVWGFFYGSDIALFLFLSLWLFERLVAAWEGESPAGAIAAAVLLALARPEGLPIAVLVGLGWVCGGPRLRRLAFGPAVVAGLAVLLVNRVATGAWLGSSVADKSLFASYGLAGGVALASEYALDVTRGLLLGFYPSQAAVGFARGWAPLMFPPLGLVFVVLAVAAARPSSRRAVALWCAVLASVAALDVPNVFLGVHFNRYVLWTFPSLLVLVAVGVGAACRRFARDDAGLDRRLFACAAALLVALSALATLRFALLYGEMAGSLAERELPTAQWIVKHLPAGVRIASAATSVEYLTGHANLNLHGVTSPAFFGGSAAERDASVLEGLVRLPVSERPGYLLSSVAAQQGSETLRELAPGAPLFATTTGTDELLVLETRWEAFTAASEPSLPETRAAVAGRREVDRLNVGDGVDESAHDYSATTALGGTPLRASARIAAYSSAAGTLRVADAGRAILGSESFAIRAQPGRDLLVVLRTASDLTARLYRSSGPASLGLSFDASAMTFTVADRDVAQERFRPREGWDEHVVTIPAAAVTAPLLHLTVSGRYASFRYWFYQ